MSSGYHSVQVELERGTSPDVLCATCPWDRLCVSPPAMTAEQIKSQIRQAADEDRSASRSGPPVTMLVTAAILSGKDTLGDLCPVFALKLSGPDGRGVSDAIRTVMRGQ